MDGYTGNMYGTAPLCYGFMQASPCMFTLVHHVAQHHKGSGDARLESECDLSRDGSTHLR